MDATRAFSSVQNPVFDRDDIPLNSVHYNAWSKQGTLPASSFYAIGASSVQESATDGTSGVTLEEKTNRQGQKSLEICCNRCHHTLTYPFQDVAVVDLTQLPEDNYELPAASINTPVDFARGVLKLSNIDPLVRKLLSSFLANPKAMNAKLVDLNKEDFNTYEELTSKQTNTSSVTYDMGRGDADAQYSTLPQTLPASDTNYDMGAGDAQYSTLPQALLAPDTTYDTAGGDAEYSVLPQALPQELYDNMNDPGIEDYGTLPGLASNSTQPKAPRKPDLSLYAVATDLPGDEVLYASATQHPDGYLDCLPEKNEDDSGHPEDITGFSPSLYDVASSSQYGELPKASGDTDLYTLASNDT